MGGGSLAVLIANSNRLQESDDHKEDLHSLYGELDPISEFL